MPTSLSTSKGHSSACPERSAKKSRPRWEVAEIFRLYGEKYRLSNPVLPSQAKSMHLIEMCRTSRLGGHIERCDTCGYERNAYNSCRNRHCPKCQTLTKEKWLMDRKRELLPVTYFHNVFTLPHDLNPLVLVNKRLIFKIFFRSVAETLKDFAKDPRWKLEGQPGFITILHTWSQTLIDHFHIHCVIPAGVLSFDRKRWISPQNDKFLFHIKPLAQTFRGKFLFYLKQAYKNKKLSFPGRTASLETPGNFYQLLRQLYSKTWVVYSKRPFAGPEQVLEYLGRYTHRVAISNHRIKSIENGQVTFSYRDRSDDNKIKEMTLSANEFIRRFLLHVLPNRFMRIRHWGFLANTSKTRSLPVIRQCLGQSSQLPEKTELSIRDMMLFLTGEDITLCPRCKSGTMETVGQLQPVFKRYDPPP